MIPFDANIFPQRKGVYIVGGSIRDLMCDRTPFDYDLVVQCDPGSFAKRLASKTSGRFVELGKHEQTHATGHHKRSHIRYHAAQRSNH